MAISERLALLVTLDANGAIKSFNDLGKAADKNLSKSSQKMDRLASGFQKAGAGMLATAGLASVALYKAGQAAGDLEQAVGGTEAVFGKASGAIDDYAKKAAQSAGLSESAFRQATTSIGGQLKGLGYSTQQAADQAVNLTQTAADLAATYGGTTAEAVQALGAALRGEADPAERFNLFLNQNRVNAKAVELGLAATTSQVDAHAKAMATLSLIEEQSADAQGQFAREADTAQGAMARFRAESENMVAALGGAVAPVLADVASGVGGLVEGFNELSPAQQSVISKAALVTTGLLGAAGAASFTVGKVIDARDRFGELAKVMTKAEGGLSKFGVASAGVTAGVGIFALALLKAQDRAQRLRDAAQALREEAEQTGDSLEDVATKKLATTFAESDRVAGAMQALGVSFEELRGPLTGSQKDFDAWSASLLAGVAGQDDYTRSAEGLIRRVGTLRGELGEAEQVSGRTAEATEALGISSDKAAPQIAGVTEEVDDQKAALDLATESMKKFKEGIEDAFGDLTLEEAADRRAQAFQDMADRFADAQKGVKDAKQRVNDLLSIKVEDRPDDFARQLTAAQADLRDAISATSRELEGNSEAALQNRDDIRGAVDDIAAVIQAHRDEGASMEELQNIRFLEREGLRKTLEQMGFNRDEIARYVKAIDDIPITKNTTITADTAPALVRIKGLADSLQALAPDQKLGIDAAIIDRNLQRASTRKAIGGPVTAGMPYSVNEYLGAGKGFEWFAPANGTISPSGPGGGVTVEQTNHFYNPAPEPASTSARKLRRVALDMAS